MYKKIYVLLFSLLLMASCTKDPSSVSRTDQYTSANYPATMDDLLSVLSGCYANLRNDRLYGFELNAHSLSNLTHTADCTYGGDQGWNEMSATSLTVNNSYVGFTWTFLYVGVKNCNAFLAAADFYEKTFAKGGDKQMINYMRGEAYFLRAFYYYHLECLYGEAYIHNGAGGDKKGVPLYTQVAPNVDSTQKPRSSVKATWDLIISDFQQAATLLKGQEWTGDNRGRISEWAAKGMLGKAYVFTEDWENARTVLQDVIAHSGKSLMPFAKYQDAFLGNADNEFNEESLFELNVDQNSRGSYGTFGGQNTTTSNGLIWAPFVVGDDGREASGGALGYGNEYVHDRNIKRFGFQLGLLTMQDNPAYDPGKPESVKNPKKTLDSTYYKQSLDIRKNKTADPRLYVNASQPFVDSAKADGMNWKLISRSTAIASSQLSNYYAWSFRKYAPLYNSMGNVGQADAANLYFLRLAEVFLLYAEANIHGGDNAVALEYLNKVKRRAYSLPVDVPSAIDYQSLTAATSAGNDPVLGHNPLYYERWAELFNEGQWWFDVCRWRIGAAEAAVYQTAQNVAGGLKWPSDDRSYSWPIPTSELNSNAKIGANNPGY
ncbi:RagB/SusD family nutrient uptake outer membrane protein [Chitinophaga sp. 30R24]|uniref:RagB/SusD family nutrient uptake outer membrane protein n=1 Tax=Chitinophaga sp. 30R24 TaxID=3248838 RepID=UPI003B8F1932